jgi:hypothetical protein
VAPPIDEVTGVLIFMKKGGGTMKKTEEKEMTLREYLSLTEKDRMEEELTRPRIEIWPDPWIDWANSHREDGHSFVCHAGGQASPFCPYGYH